MNVSITITVDQVTGTCTVEGAIENKIVAYGLLALAQETISQFHASQQRTGKILPIHGQINGNGGHPA